MSLRWILGVIMTFHLGVWSSKAEILSLPTIKDVKNKIESVFVSCGNENMKPEDVWVGFDVDMTLIQPDHPAAYYPNLKKHYDLYKSILGTLTSEEKDIVNNILIQTIPYKLVEKDNPKTVREIQNLGVRTFAFTASITGKISTYKEKMFIFRQDQLLNFGFRFSKRESPFHLVVPFMDFPKYCGHYPMLFHGILFANGEGGVGKGDVMAAFLDHMGRKHLSKTGKGYFPKIVILIDDRRKNLESTEAALKQHDPTIQFIGIEYQGAFQYAPKEISEGDFRKFWENLAERAKKELETKGF